ncbi:GPP34 family phosphoprotein [Nonomuraea sp. NN258]|uniref:GOLPH3/VPS74 family protein n=1 Tax=Nonomuraea antri TaxID=2730852 RepID=UPI001569D971|nr:GPP34 family phosphoprotein [Nonomuraea antri]NRQ32843.1 GPP34 family phosphoprotein [Nonomuraea antri]
MERLPLHQELYLISHDHSGKPLIHQSSMALGLAGAVLLDLALRERLTIVQGQASVSDRTPVGDAVTDSLIPQIAQDRANRDVKFWIKRLAPDMYDRTCGSLVAAGVLTKVTKRRLGMLPYTRYQLTDMAAVVRAAAGVRSAVEGWKQPDDRSAALCGLVAVLRVETELYLDQPSSQLVGRLRTIARESTPAVQDVVTIVETLIAEAALAVYR